MGCGSMATLRAPPGRGVAEHTRVWIDGQRLEICTIAVAMKPRVLRRTGPSPRQNDAWMRKARRESVRFVLPSIGAFGLLGGCSSGGGTNHGLGEPSPAGGGALHTLTTDESVPDGGDDATPACNLNLGGTLSGFWGPCEEITCSNTLVLQNSGGDDLTLTDNGPFSFVTPLSPGQAFAVTVLSQPPDNGPNGGQTCVVSAGTGVAGSQDVTNVAVNCTTNAYTLGGTVSGLRAGRGGITVSSFAFTTIPKGGQRFLAQQGLHVAGDGSPSETFTLPMPVLSSSIYWADLDERAALGQICALTSGGGGRVSDANITNLEVTCASVPYLYSFETGGENLPLGSWQHITIDPTNGVTLGNTGETRQTADFHTQGLFGLKINGGPDAAWFGNVYGTPIDLSGTTHLKWDVETVLDPTTQELAIQTGDDWTWCQGGGWPWLVAGTTTTMDVDLTHLDCNAPDLSQVHALYIYFGNGSTGTFYVDNVRAE
jgi:hypothetical protein